jgi:hypothetical protein
MFAFLNDKVSEGVAVVRRGTLNITYGNPAFRSMFGLKDEADLSETNVLGLFDTTSGDILRGIVNGTDDIDTAVELHANVFKEREVGPSSFFVSTSIKSFAEGLLFVFRDQSSSGGKSLRLFFLLQILRATNRLFPSIRTWSCGESDCCCPFGDANAHSRLGSLHASGLFD